MGLELVIAGFAVRHTTEHDVEPGDTGTWLSMTQGKLVPSSVQITSFITEMLFK